MDILHAHVCTVYLCVSSAHGGQKRALHPPGKAVINSCELPVGCWESNPGLLEEQPVLLTADLFLPAPWDYFLAKAYGLHFLNGPTLCVPPQCVCVCVSAGGQVIMMGKFR